MWDISNQYFSTCQLLACTGMQYSVAKFLSHKPNIVFIILHGLFQGTSVKLCLVISSEVKKHPAINIELPFHLACKHVGIVAWKLCMFMP